MDIINPLHKPVKNLRAGRVYNLFEEYFKDTKSKGDEEKELHLISLIDGENIELLLNRNGKINCKSYPPYVMYLDTYERLTK